MGEMNLISESYRSHETPPSINRLEFVYGNAEKTAIPLNRYPLNRGDTHSPLILLLWILSGLFIALLIE